LHSIKKKINRIKQKSESSFVNRLADQHTSFSTAQTAYIGT